MTESATMPRGTKLAAATGVPVRTVQRHLAGDVKITAGTLRLYAAAILPASECEGPVWALLSHFAGLEAAEAAAP